MHRIHPGLGVRVAEILRVLLIILCPSFLFCTCEGRQSHSGSLQRRNIMKSDAESPRLSDRQGVSLAMF